MRSEIAPPTGSQMKFERPTQSVTIITPVRVEMQRLAAEGRRVDGDQDRTLSCVRIDIITPMPMRRQFSATN